MRIAGRLVLLIVLSCGACAAVGQKRGGWDIVVYHGTSDASAAVAVGEDMFVMADDENNILRVYRQGESRAVYSYNMTEFLKTVQDHPEADIEGAARVGRRIYWITSHGRNKDGKPRPNRYRFFAVDIENTDGKIEIMPAGEPCRTLLRALTGDKRLRSLGLAKAAGTGFSLSDKDRKKLAPKREGLNIEGLCASADGRILYIGFRNPRPIDKSTGRGCALVVPMLNAKRVIDDGQRAVLGEPMLWDFGGIGIRSMEYSPRHKAYFIVAGAHDETPDFALYRWSGVAADKPELVKNLSQSNFSPEALIPFAGRDELLLLSDDGTLPVAVVSTAECAEDELRADGTCPNKFLTNPNRKTFRATELTP